MSGWDGEVTREYKYSTAWVYPRFCDHRIEWSPIVSAKRLGVLAHLNYMSPKGVQESAALRRGHARASAILHWSDHACGMLKSIRVQLCSVGVPTRCGPAPWAQVHAGIMRKGGVAPGFAALRVPRGLRR